MNKPLFRRRGGLDDVTARSPEAPPSLAHSLAQVAGDIFEDFVVFLGEAAQDVLHGLEALLPVVDL